MYKIYEPFGKTNKIKIYQRPLCQVESSFLEGAPSINEVRRMSRYSCRGFCSISRVVPGIMVVDKFLFCLFCRMVHKSYTLIFCLEEWFKIFLYMHISIKFCLRLFHHFSFHSCCSYWILVYRYSCRGFCSISRVGPRRLCVWSNSLKGGAGNTYMPLHDHPYSVVNIIYSVVQTGGKNHAPGDKFSPKH
jgi:hypothetical protein